MASTAETAPTRPGQKASSRHSFEERRELILGALAELERPNATDLRRHTGIAARTIERDLRRLREEGVVEFVGELRTGFYKRR